MSNDLSFWHEAEYNGEYFESMTEAAWGAYFDAVGMPLVREPETFQFDFGTNIYPKMIYTPDFYLPEQDTYAEVKNGNITQDAIDKMHYLAIGTGKAVLALLGKPHYGYVEVFGSDNIHKNMTNGNYRFDYRYSMQELYIDNSRQCFTELNIRDAVVHSRESWTINVDPSIAEAALKRRKEMQNNPTVLRIEH